MTTREAADRVWPRMFERWPTPDALAGAPEADLADLLRPLGCWRRRAVTLRRMSADYAGRPPVDADDVPRLYGLGQYARDSWAIFVDGVPCWPDDLMLRAYVCARDAGVLDWFHEQLPERREAAEAFLVLADDDRRIGA